MKELGSGIWPKGGRIRARETLYKGMNGKLVERIWLSASESYVRKPETNDGQQARERWAYERLLPALPPIYPRLVASVSPEEGAEGWSLFEDLGPLDHSFREEAATELVGQIARWHALPVQLLSGAPSLAPKPRIEAMAEAIARAWGAEGDGLFDGRADGGSEGGREGGWSEARKLAGIIANGSNAKGRARAAFGGILGGPDVVSHGDLHIGNYALADGRLKVLDWEHVHRNSRYWDLYHAIDLTHPLFPKTVEDAVRLRLLSRYAAESAARGTLLEEEAFIRGYRAFAAVFSLWLLLLIESDLRRGSAPWPRDELVRQRGETLAGLADNAGAM